MIEFHQSARTTESETQGRESSLVFIKCSFKRPKALWCGHLCDDAWFCRSLDQLESHVSDAKAMRFELCSRPGPLRSNPTVAT